MILKINEKLRKDNVTLTLLNEKFIDSLVKLSDDKRIWQYVPEKFHESTVFQENWIHKAIKQIENDKRICFVVSFSEEIVGSSSYYQLDLENKKLNIGYTWFHPKFWGTKVNPLTKLIMLEYAFETLNCVRVEFSVDAVNLPSRKALNNLGIQQEGILRNHLTLSDGRIRDSVIFSVTYQEWPEIKNNIQRRLNQHG